MHEEDEDEVVKGKSYSGVRMYLEGSLMSFFLMERWISQGRGLRRWSLGRSWMKLLMALDFAADDDEEEEEEEGEDFVVMRMSSLCCLTQASATK